MIQCSNPRAQYLSHKEEIDAALQRVLEKGWYILGEEVQAFENEFAAFIGVAHAVGVASGTDALHMALVACGVAQGDEVITVSHTAVATVAAIDLCGSTPVLVDVEPNFYTLDPAKLEAAISSRTRVIIPVHLYGQAADMERILEIAGRHDLRVIEDCAQAHGATYGGRRVGAFGDMACFSFYPTKNLGAFGDGGMIVTNDGELAARARLLREYGWGERYVSCGQGWNSRLDEIQAAVLRVKLNHLESDNARRARLAKLYDVGLPADKLGLPREREDGSHVYHQYVVRCPGRDELQQFLKSRKIGTLIHYPVPVHLQPAYKRLNGVRDLSQTERLAGEILSLPIYPELTDSDVGQVVDAIRGYYRSAGA